MPDKEIQAEISDYGVLLVTFLTS